MRVKKGFINRNVCGESVLLPAALNEVQLTPKASAKILEVYIDASEQDLD